MSTGKKVSVPNYFFFYRADSLLPEGSLRKALLEPVISSFDSESLSSSVLNEAIRSVTHLVLAPDQESSLFFLHLKTSPSLSWSFLRLTGAPIPRLRDQKTFSTGPCSFSLKELRLAGPVARPRRPTLR
jgi:hypothetical protein